jgi:hypothetical protein
VGNCLEVDLIGTEELCHGNHTHRLHNRLQRAQ